ncbi:MAG: DUF2442 domain-containing protein [Gammaproteobacteria bacterium]|nr:DUF2442 domain-containing protein [Gammaproteobacteria bacterium]
MSTSANNASRPVAASISFEVENLIVELRDGRSISVPVSWYPRLEHASPVERSHWELLGSGSGIRWPDIDEDISVDALLAGRRSTESQSSLALWLENRRG